MRQIDHFIVGGSGGAASRHSDVFDPNNGGVQAQVALGDAAVLERAVQAAAKAQPGWAAMNPQRRARVMFEFKSLIEKNMDELVHMLSAEHGKVIADSKGDIQRGLEVVEFCCGLPHVMKGEYTNGAGPGIDVYSMRQPIGIGAGITPINFPAMIPLWMGAVATSVGNAFILKPSERDPTVPVRLAELFLEAGMPEGIFQVVHGDKEMVDLILDHPAIGAVSFVGSSDIAQYVYSRGVAAGKRIQAMGGAKNHGIVMPDADLDQVVGDLCGAAFGSAGERCMAISVVLAVDSIADALVDKLSSRIPNIKVGPGTDPAAEMGPLISREHRDKVASFVTNANAEGAKVVIDGTDKAKDAGFFLNPSLIDNVKPGMKCYDEEIFGPVLTVMRVKSYQEGLDTINANQFGNGTAIFTRDGGVARQFQFDVQVGMVGINVPIPVPVSYYSFGGWKASLFGDQHMYGPEGINFFTRGKVITSRWPDPRTSSVNLGFPQNR